MDHRSPLGQRVPVRQRQEIEEIAGGEQSLDVVFERDVGDADLVVWVTAPPNSSWVTTSLVTVFTTSVR
jgi:hypothetical protein